MNLLISGRPGRRRAHAVIAMVWMAAALLVGAAALTGSAHAAETGKAPVSLDGSPAQEGDTFTSYLPIAFNQFNVPTVYGVEMTTATTGPRTPTS